MTRSLRNVSVRSALVLLAVAVLCAWPARALADGDPASDALVSQPVYLAADSGVSYAQEARLAALVAAAQRAGHPLRVAVIARRADLGSVGALWRQPARYAAFLGRELSLVFGGELLVVMPNGFGVSHGGEVIRTPLQGLAPRPGELLTAAAQAVRRLTGVSAPSAVVVPARGGGRSPMGVVSWLGALVAVSVIAGVWAASLRARPPGGRWRRRVFGLH